MTRNLLALPFFSLLTVLLGACASYPENPPLHAVDPSQGYRFQGLALGPNNSDETFVLLSLSGGGMRATALEYGVFEALQAARFGEQGASLLDEVDVITAVSGGALPAAYYGAHGREKFFAEFREEVLYRQIETDLVLRFLAPWHWPKLWAPYYGRSELFEEYFDEALFQGRTFADLPAERPFIVMTATDMTLGAQFAFVQEHFDRLCSDLDGVTLARAVTASIAFPIAFTPMTLNNYDKSACAYQRPDWVDHALDHELEANSRRYDRAVNWTTYEETETRPYVHLLDGGISDNMGLRISKLALVSGDSSWGLLDKIVDGTVKRLVLIAVDARSREYLNESADQSPSPPGPIDALISAAGNPVDNYATETVELVRQFLLEMREERDDFDDSRQHCQALAESLCRSTSGSGSCVQEHQTLCYREFGLGDAARPNIPEIYIIHLRFEQVADKALRLRLQSVATSLQLPREDVDLLVESAKLMLEQSGEFRRLMESLNRGSD